jgi:hypothetical protein
MKAYEDHQRKAGKFTSILNRQRDFFRTGNRQDRQSLLR